MWIFYSILLLTLISYISKKSGQKSQRILTTLFITFTYVLFLFFQKLNASIWEIGEYTRCARFIQ